MNHSKLIMHLQELGYASRKEFYREAFSRNVGLLSAVEQGMLAKSTVAIPGMGGVGGSHLISLARCGVGRYHLADYDTFCPANTNRQYGANIANYDRSKLDVMVEEAEKINPFIEMKKFPRGVDSTNLDEFLDGVDVVLDGLDFFAFDIRRKLFNRARDKGIPVITAAPLGFSVALLIFAPDCGLSFDQYFAVDDFTSQEDALLHFALGLAPRGGHLSYLDLSQVDLQAKIGPSSVIACYLCSAWATTEALRILLHRDGLKPVPYYRQFDPFKQKLYHGYLWRGNRNPLQKIKKKVVKRMMVKNLDRKGLRQVAFPDLNTVNGGISDEMITYLVAMGTWATSADNCQPWRFSWDGEKLQVFEDPDRTGFFYDVNRESIMIAAGAVVENMKIAATGCGYATQITLFPDANEQTLIAELQFLPAEIEEDPLRDVLLHRCTNRRPYNKNPLPVSVMEELEGAICHDSVKLQLITGNREQKRLRKMIFNADRVLFEDQRLHAGLFRWVHLAKGGEQGYDDGMDLDVLGLDWLQQRLFPLLADWRILKRLHPLGITRAIGMNSIKLLKSSPAYALITVDSRTPESYFQGGMDMERFWLAATAQGLSVHPMAGFVFLLNHYFYDQGQQFCPRHRRMICEMADQYRSLFDQPSGGGPLMFFRLGYAAPQAAKSSRRAVANVLVKAQL